MVSSTGAEDAVRQLLHDFGSMRSLDRSWFTLLVQLLRLARTHAPAAPEWSDVPGSIALLTIMDVEANVAALLTRDGDELTVRTASTDDVDAAAAIVAERLDSWTAPQRDFAAVLIARGVAGGIDAAFNDQFLHSLRERVTEVVVRPDEPYPVSRHSPLRYLGGQSANTPPDRHPTRNLDSVPHLRLGDADDGAYRFVIDLSLWSELGVLNAASDLIMVAAQPNLSLAEFAVDRLGDPPTAFRNHGPRDTGTQRAILVNQLVAASAAAAKIVVLPEYCLAELERDNLLEAVRELDPPPALLVAGSSEVDDPDDADAVRNEAWLWWPFGEGHGHQKVFAAQVDGLAEDIKPGTEVRVFRTENWTFAVLICRDAASPELLHMLTRIGVNLLMVPTFSDRVGTIVGRACSLSMLTQGFVVVACGPAEFSEAELPEDHEHSGMRAEAAFSAPYERYPGPVLAPSDDTGLPRGRGIWIFNPGSRSVSWQPTGK